MSLVELFSKPKKEKRTVIAEEPEGEDEIKKARRIGQNSALRFTKQGVLGSATVGRKQLTAF